MNPSNAASRLVKSLAQHDLRIVFAESCTGGLVSATLAEVPGVSEWLCGSAVTYRERTKTAWLDVSTEDLANHSAVSEPVAAQMAAGVLQRTPEADLAASITGHLGPGAPAEFDGVVFIGISRRAGDSIEIVSVTRHQLGGKSRVERQREAANFVLAHVAEWIATGAD